MRDFVKLFFFSIAIIKNISVVAQESCSSAITNSGFDSNFSIYPYTAFSDASNNNISFSNSNTEYITCNSMQVIGGDQCPASSCSLQISQSTGTSYISQIQFISYEIIMDFADCSQSTQGTLTANSNQISITQPLGGNQLTTNCGPSAQYTCYRQITQIVTNINSNSLVLSYQPSSTSGGGYFAFQQIILLAQLCPSNCTSCNDTTCLTCIDGYVVVSGACSQCDNSCASCTGTDPTNCVLCATNLYYDVPTSLCVGSCQTNEYVSTNQATSQQQCSLCDPSCATCSGSQPTNCLTCASGLYLFQKQCLQACPNNYSENPTANTCDLCADYTQPQCNTCFATCQMCVYQSLTTVNNQCLSCFPPRQLNQDGTCGCQNVLDTRTDFYLCSYKNIAVLSMTLSATTPTLTIDFGSPLQPLVNSSTPSSAFCATIFDAASLALVDANSLCSISGNTIVVNLDAQSTLMDNDYLNILPNVLAFVGYTQTIDTFYRNFVHQIVPAGLPRLIFKYDIYTNACNPIIIQLKQLVNDAQRGFLSLQWTFVNTDTQITASGLNQISTIITTTNQNQGTTITFPPGIFQAGSYISFQLNFKLKVNYETYYGFHLNYVNKTMKAEYQQTTFPPYYRSDGFVYLFTYHTETCTPTGVVVSYEAAKNVTVVSDIIPSVVPNITNLQPNSFSVTIAPYLLPTNSFFFFAVNMWKGGATGSTIIEIDTGISDLYIEIRGGRNQMVGNSAISHVIANARDPEVPSATSPQGLTFNWVCKNLVTADGVCNTAADTPFVFNPAKQMVTIPAGTFADYTVLQFSVTGTKDTRAASDTAIYLFSDISLPTFIVFSAIQAPNVLVNINSVTIFILEYNLAINSDLLTYGGALIYDGNVVATLTYDYLIVRFAIWDHFTNINPAIPKMSVRFTVYDPTVAQSSQVTFDFTLNMPPTNCLFSISPLTGDALSTNFTISLQNCQSAQAPLTYLFFYYLSNDDYTQELIAPWNIMRRILQDQGAGNGLVTKLPAGKLLIMGQTLDTNYGIFNMTKVITVNPIPGAPADVINEYNSLIATSLQIPKIQNQLVSLCIIGEDIARNHLVKTYQTADDIKANLIALIQTAESQLPVASQLFTFATKVISALQNSLTKKSEVQCNTLVSLIQNTLQNSAFVANEGENNYQRANNFAIQNLVDSLKILDSSLNANTTYSESFYDSVSNSTMWIAQYYEKFFEPNQGALVFKGDQFSLLVDQITAKNLYLYAKAPQSVISPNYTAIYSVAVTTYNQNVYQNTTRFENYTNQLENIKPNFTYSLNPVILSQINTTGTTTPVVNSTIYYEFKNTTASNTTNMTCIQRDELQWTNANCSLVQNTNTDYTCLCKRSLPTTVIEDISSLFFDNKNLNTAFGSQGLSNIESINSPQKYAVIWILLSTTIGEIGLYLLGRRMDFKCKNKSQLSILPYSEPQIQLHQQTDREIELSNKNSPTTQFHNTNANLNDHHKDFSPLNVNYTKQQKQIRKLSNFVDINKSGVVAIQLDDNIDNDAKQDSESVQQNKLKQLRLSNNDENQSLKGPKSVNESNSKLINLNSNNPSMVINNNQKETLSIINDNVNKNNNGNMATKYDNMSQLSKSQPDMMLESMKDDFQLTTNMIQANANPKKSQASNSNNTLDQKIDDLNLDTKSVKSKNKSDEENHQLSQTTSPKKDPHHVPEIKPKTVEYFKHQNVILQILIFHPFVNIFLVYDKDLSRGTRFQLFYLKIVHSLSISVIFGSYTAIDQQIVVAIVNALVLETFSFIIQFTYKKGVLGRRVSSGIQVALLFGYYYIILAIQSGQPPSQSNMFVGLFFVMLAINFLFVQFLTAALQMFITRKLIYAFSASVFLIYLFELFKIKEILENINY